MSNVIDFLELVGQNSSLRHADSKAIGAALAKSDIDAQLWSAVAQGNTQEIENALGIPSNVCAVIFPVDPDERAYESIHFQGM